MMMMYMQVLFHFCVETKIAGQFGIPNFFEKLTCREVMIEESHLSYAKPIFLRGYRDQKNLYKLLSYIKPVKMDINAAFLLKFSSLNKGNTYISL